MRRVALAVLVAFAAAACGSGGPGASDGGPGAQAGGVAARPDAVRLEPVEAGPEEDVPSALRNRFDRALPEPVVDPLRIVPGGPAPDGIPPIDDPRFEPAGSVTWLGDAEPVIALSLDEHERAYPVQVLTWHEIVNDTVGGRPVAVTYCPLCNSALAFDRRVDGRLLTFGTSGSLYLSALVMYDRQTESLWSQVERRAIAGALSGTELELVPVSTVRWSDWRDAHPDGWVLSRATGFVRDYGRNPYVGYDADSRTLLDERADGRYPAKERVVTFPDADEAVAVLLADLDRVRVAEVEVDGEPVVLFASPGLASSLDAADLARGREIAATGAFRPVVGERRLTFAPSPGEGVAVDAETGSTWDVLGRAVAGPLEGSRLTPVPHLDTFWFAQAAFRPQTEVLDLG